MISVRLRLPRGADVCPKVTRIVTALHSIIGPSTMTSGCGAAKRKNGKALLRCGKCKTAQYCSKECQMDMWPAHKANASSRRR